MNLRGKTYAYDGITAEVYDLWFTETPVPVDDVSFYKKHIRANGGLALEVGSGTGRLMLSYIQDGLDVHGLEVSSDMINICNSKAEEMGFSPIVHDQDMRALKVSYSYKTIYIPLYTFQLIIYRDEVFETLRRFYLHLDKGGQLLISLVIPGPSILSDSQGVWKFLRTAVRSDDEATVVLSESVLYDKFEQVQTRWLKYDVAIKERIIDSYIKFMHLRWYYQHEFAMMLEKIGFSDIQVYGDYAGNLANGKHDVWIFSARK